MIYFEGHDLKLIEALVYDPSLKPSFEHMRGGLVWSDEYCRTGLSPEGYEKLCDLWGARSFIHKEKPFSSWALDPIYFEKVWENALSANFKWPGFNRIELSEEDKKYLIDELKKDEELDSL